MRSQGRAQRVYSVSERYASPILITIIFLFFQSISSPCRLFPPMLSSAHCTNTPTQQKREYGAKFSECSGLNSGTVADIIYAFLCWCKQLQSKQGTYSSQDLHRGTKRAHLCDLWPSFDSDSEPRFRKVLTKHFTGPGLKNCCGCM